MSSFSTYIWDYDEFSKLGIQVQELAEEFDITVKESFLYHGNESTLKQFDCLILAKRHMWSSRLKEFPGNCAWLVLHSLPDFTANLESMIKVAEGIGRVYHYAGLFLSHTEHWNKNNYELLAACGYEKRMTSFNKHSQSTVNLLYKDLSDG